MSRFWSPVVHDLTPYVPGEQPKLANLVKLNTNENPYGPSPKALAAMREALSEKIGTRTVDLSRLVVDQSALGYVPREQAKRHSLFPLVWDEATGQLTLAMANPNNIVALDQIRLQAGHRLRHIVPVLASESDINRAIDQYYGYELSIDGILREIETGEVDAASLALGQGEYSQPVVRLIDALLADAVQREASDLHFEPEESFIRIRYRIDGVLINKMVYDINLLPAIAARVKILGGMDISEKRKPQDGRLKTRTPKGQETELRLSTLPTAFGEKLVMRIFDPDVLVRSFQQLGFEGRLQESWNQLTGHSHGIILVTGPTGSGKTTTLYSSLKQLATEEVNVCTIEDPIEMLEPSFNQMQVNPNIELGFADGVRALMRQDPDIIMVGEIRDHDTANMAIQAALTGHLVLSTLHTNDAPSSLTRLHDLGVQPFLTAATILGVLAQRLVRRLCPHCKVEKQINSQEWEHLTFDYIMEMPEKVFTAVGCEECRQTGYKGRVGIYEFMPVSLEAKQLIGANGDLTALRQQAKKEGIEPLRIAGVRKVLEGVTTLEEVLRVVPLN